MFSENEKISIRQLQAIIIFIIFGSTSLSLPRIISEIGSQNGWILIISSTVILMGYSLLIVTLGKLFPNETIVEYSKKIVTKPIGYLISILLVVHFVIFLGFQLRLFGELIKQTLLINTPIEVIMMVILFSVAYLARQGLECKGRIEEITIFIVFIIVSVVILFSLEKIKYEHFTPLLIIKSKDFFYGTYFLSLFGIGMESLFITIAFVNNKKRLYKGVIQAILFVMVVNLLINFTTVGIFGPKATAKQLWPFLSSMLAIDLPGSFIERQDAIMISFWILTEFALLNSFLYFSSFTLSRIIKSKKSNWINFILIPIVYVIALIPNNVPETFKMAKNYILKFGLFFLFFVPLILLLVAKARKLGEKNEV